MEVLGAFVILGIFLTAVAIVRGLVLTQLWSWFIVPFGAPEIGVAWAIGISLIVGYLTHQVQDSDSDDGLSWETVLRPFLLAFFAFVFGAIAHAFM